MAKTSFLNAFVSIDFCTCALIGFYVQGENGAHFILPHLVILCQNPTLTYDYVFLTNNQAFLLRSTVLSLGS